MHLLIVEDERALCDTVARSLRRSAYSVDCCYDGEKALELLSIFDMQGMAQYRAGSLPYGAQRRLEILRALASNPCLLLLDEPAAGMNPSETAELMENIRKIRDTFQIAVLLIEHDMNLVMNICEGICVLNFGRIIAKGTPDEIRDNPQVIEACRAYLPGNACRMDDRRVHIYYENALKFIRKCEDEYDLIIVDSSDPFGPSEGLFTREFYGSCFNALRADGIMVNQQGSPFYAEDASAMQRSHKRIASTFPISRVYQAHIPTFAAGYWLFGFASKKYHPIDDLDAAAWKALNMRTRYYTTKLHIGAFYLPAFLEEMLREVEEH